MSDAPIVPDDLVAPGVRDARQIAFARMLDASLAEIDLTSFVMTDVMTVDPVLLPAMAREFSVEEFIEPDLPEGFVRKFIRDAHQLHAGKGYIEGVRWALRLIGVEVRWVQWWQQEPPGAPNTHKVTAYVNDQIFEGETDLFSPRNIAAVLRIIDAMKRWSQEIDFNLGMGLSAAAGATSAAAAASAALVTSIVRPTIRIDKQGDVVSAATGLVHHHFVCEVRQ